MSQPNTSEARQALLPTAEIDRLRRLKWSVTAIARHLRHLGVTERDVAAHLNVPWNVAGGGRRG